MGKQLERWLVGLSSGLQVLAGIGSAIAMVAAFLVGFAALAQTLTTALGNVAHGSGEAKGAVAGILASLEWFFLAPLPFLSVHGIIKYFKHQHEALIEVKRLVVGQIIAVIATNLVERLAAQSGQIDRDRVIASVSLIFSLSAYLWTAHISKSPSGGDGRDNPKN